MLLLFQKQYEDDFFELLPIVISKYDWKIKEYLQNLLKPSVIYDNKLEKHGDECKNIIRNYLLNNYNAITGWRDAREQVGTNYPINDKEKNRIIDFICCNYSFSYGKNIVEANCGNGFINRCCDVEKLSTPYPKLQKPPEQPISYYKKEWFCIKKVEYLD